MVKYRINVLEALKEAGYSSYRLRKEKIMGESIIQRLREDKSVSFAELSKICDMLGCDIGDVLMYEPDEK